MRLKVIVGLMVLVLAASFVVAPGSNLSGIGSVSTANAQNFCESESDFVSLPNTFTGTITNQTYIIYYCINGQAGQQITVSAEATSGNLDTYLYLTDTTGNEIFAEDDDGGSGTDSEFSATLPTTGSYMILVTRFNLEDGSSTGNFSMTASISGSGSGGGLGGLGGGTSDPVVFDYPTVGDGSESVLGDGAIFISCDTGQEIRGGVQFSFINVNPGFSYTVTAVGIDGFDPVLAVETQPGIGTCNDDTAAVAGTRIDVPGLGNVTADRLSSQVRFTTPRRGFPVNISVGSFNDSAGQFALIIEGFVISPFTELDGFSVRVPESVAQQPLGVYMVARFTDLDPYMYIGTGPGLTRAYDIDGNFDYELINFDQVFGPLYECDSIGFGLCDFTEPFFGGTIDVTNGSSYNPDNRIDAGLTLIPNTADPILYFFGSSGGVSGGTYAILVTGFVPGVE